MPGFNKRAQVSGGDAVVNALRGYISNAAALVAEAVQEEQEDLVARQQARAQEDPRWSELVQQVNSWEDDDGSFATGVRDDPDAVSKASQLEYGDEKNPPSPLLRMGVLSDVADINWRLNDTFRRGGF